MALERCPKPASSDSEMDKPTSRLSLLRPLGEDRDEELGYWMYMNPALLPLTPFREEDLRQKSEVGPDDLEMDMKLLQQELNAL